MLPTRQPHLLQSAISSDSAACLTKLWRHFVEIAQVSIIRETLGCTELPYRRLLHNPNLCSAPQAEPRSFDLSAPST